MRHFAFRTRSFPRVTDNLPAGTDEILLSKDKTITIIDGSGTIHDPLGLNRTELIRLAKGRKTISEFDVSKLGKDGYRVLVDDRDLVLPCASFFLFGRLLRVLEG